MRILKGFVLAFLLFCYSTLQCAQSQEPKDSSAASSGASAYPESPDGLTSFIEDMLDAMKSGRTDRTSSYFSNLAIPDHSSWFVKIFGPEEGGRLDARYGELLPQAPNKISQRLKYALDSRRTDVKVTVLQKPVDPSARLGRVITEAMIQPVALYSASGTSPGEKYPAYLGDFVFVEGAFRYADTEVFQALSTAPPLRIRQGGNVTTASIVHKVAPNYPDEARLARTQGSVVLHVILGTDGAVKEVEPVSGDPVLSSAAIEAVKQWKYKPTLLNGQPVEVDTTITIEFHL